MWNPFSKKVAPVSTTSPTASYSVSDSAVGQFFSGSKFTGGMDIASVLALDYYTLRVRSREIFGKNHYGSGIVKAIGLSKISTGLTLESQIPASIVGRTEDALAETISGIESRFDLWAKHARNCDYSGLENFYELQAKADEEAVITGDCLIILHYDKASNNTKIQLVPGDHICASYRTKIPKGNTVEYGVELNAKGKQVAYHIQQRDGTSKRVLAYGSKSGRRVAWMYYAYGQKPLGSVRGTPLLTEIMQALQELDKYKDYQIRSAVVNSMIAVWVEKSEDRPGTNPIGGGAIRKTPVTQTSEGARDYNILTQAPGQVYDELGYGEKIKAHQGNQAVEGFGAFEQAIIDSLAWSKRIPPEILRMSFNSNYSASQAAKNEYAQTLRVWRGAVATKLCQPVYEDWLLNQALSRKILLPEMLVAWRNRGMSTEFSAWVASDWTAPMVPTTDILKNAKAYDLMVKEGYMTADFATKEMTGQKWSTVIDRRAKEIQKMKDLGIIEEGEFEDENEENT